VKELLVSGLRASKFAVEAQLVRLSQVFIISPIHVPCSDETQFTDLFRNHYVETELVSNCYLMRVLNLPLLFETLQAAVLTA
jgi:hypothetical protein